MPTGVGDRFLWASKRLRLIKEFGRDIRLCGIMGCEGRTDLTKKILPLLAIYMNDRGRDSWGVTDGSFTYRSVGQIIDQFDELDLISPTYHCRAASVGAVSQRNAHPFEFKYTSPNGTESKRVVGVHNGHLSNWSDLKTRFDRKDFEVDSEHIFAHLAEDKDLRDIEGWGAVVWYEQRNDGPITRFFSKFGTGDLSFAKLKSGEIVFASTQRALEIAIRLSGGMLDTFYKISPDVKYTIVDNELKNCGELKWGGTKPTHTSNHNYNRGLINITNYSDTRDICAMRDCHVVVKSDELICWFCLKRIKEEYGFDMSMGQFGAY